MHKKFIRTCTLATIAIISASVSAPPIAMESISDQEFENMKTTIRNCETYRGLLLSESPDPYPLPSRYSSRKPAGHEVNYGRGVAYLAGYNWSECHWGIYSAVTEKSETNTELASYMACKTCESLIKSLQKSGRSNGIDPEPNCVLM